ncbi:hypothetical protein [Paenibacillus endoradicis]|uniref:hypothetical protein n=1 Tax=Paenibacillus endoradicis TaxID=2972487 RepID=UPI0021597CDB|nr:hypothetical protein [Paenibacillus endoradicis]MCR8657830.1 hypothetical protein [Paenibacillus endoradicis]
MKQNKIGIVIGIISIVAFLTTLISTIIFANNVIKDEEQKSAYYADLYGLVEEADEIDNEPIKYPSQEYLIDQESNGYNAIKKLRVLHSQSDYYLMGGRIDHYTTDADEQWSKIMESTFLQQSEYESIRDNLSQEEEIVKDMNNMIALLNIATKQRNLEAMRYMHRILHDLDLYGFTAQGVTPSGYWGATYAVPSSNSSQLDEITTFIEKHKVTS